MNAAQIVALIAFALWGVAYWLATRNRPIEAPQPEPELPKPNPFDEIFDRIHAARLGHRQVVDILITPLAAEGTLLTLPRAAERPDELTLYLHPDDWRRLRTESSLTETTHYGAPSWSAPTIWGLPIVEEYPPAWPNRPPWADL